MELNQGSIRRKLLSVCKYFLWYRRCDRNDYPEPVEMSSPFLGSNDNNIAVLQISPMKVDYVFLFTSSTNVRLHLVRVYYRVKNCSYETVSAVLHPVHLFRLKSYVINFGARSSCEFATKRNSQTA